MKINKIISVSLIISLLLCNQTFSNFVLNQEENSFVELIQNLSSKEIRNAVESSPYTSVGLEANGLKLFTDHNGNLIEDIRELYKHDKYIIAVNRLQMMLTIYGFNYESNIFNIPIVSFPISCNYTKTIAGAHKITSKYRWHRLFGESNYGQYSSRYSSKLLFHSALYATKSNISLKPYSYNSIVNKVQSGGCIRLRVEDAKWIYDNIPSGTTVIVYDSYEECPFKRPELEEISLSQYFDPSDKEVNINS